MTDQNGKKVRAFNWVGGDALSGKRTTMVHVNGSFVTSSYSESYLTEIGAFTYFFIKTKAKGTVWAENIRLNDRDEFVRLYFEKEKDAAAYIKEQQENYVRAEWEHTFENFHLPRNEAMEVSGIFSCGNKNKVFEDRLDRFIWARTIPEGKIFYFNGLLLFTDMNDLVAYKLKFG